MISNRKKRITITLDAKKLEKLKSYAKKKHTTLSLIFNVMMYTYINDYVDILEFTEKNKKDLDEMIKIAKTPWLED